LRAQCSGADQPTQRPVPTAKPLAADVFELARERRTIEGELPLSALPRLATSLLRSDGPLAYRIRGTVDERGRPGAQMQLQAELVLECQRCNQELAHRLQRDAQFRFVGSEEELNALPVEDDEVDLVVGARHMDIAAWVEDEAILSLPLVPRHDDCRPAIPLAAADASADSGAKRPNPFAALAGLKTGRKAG
jgi:uncharacterized protein